MISRLIAIAKSNVDLTGLNLFEPPNKLEQFASFVYRLDMGFNQFFFFPDIISTFSKLEELTLDGNQLSYLPPSIGSLKNLKILSLNGNKLQKLPHEIG